MDNELPLSRKIIAFVLTLIAVPILFAATCTPVGLFAGGMSNGPYFAISVLSFCALFLAAAIGVAIRARNPGIRLAIIVQLALTALAGAWWAITLWLH